MATYRKNDPGRRLFNQAMLLSNGKYNLQNLKRAAQLLKAAASMNSLPAIDALGSFYSYGTGLRKNPYVAFKYYKRAALAGYPGAQYNLARVSWPAIAWYQKAAKNDDKEIRESAKHALTKLANSFPRFYV
jgi:TPR repeat protein